MPTARQAYLSRSLKRRKIAQDVFAYRLLVAEPVSLDEPLVLPANARIAMSHSAGVEAGELRLVRGSADPIPLPALDADQVWRMQYYGKNEQFDVECDVAGTTTLYVLDEWSRPLPIATKIFE